jgi:hypothetical protein
MCVIVNCLQYQGDMNLKLETSGADVILAQLKADYENNDTIDMMHLAHLHPVEKFNGVEFEEGPHLYIVDGETYNGSVTGHIHRYFKNFETEAAIDNILACEDWSTNIQYKYYLKSRKEIKELGAVAAAEGTVLHYLIERFYNCPELYNKNNFSNELLSRYYKEKHYTREDFKQCLEFHIRIVLVCKWKPFRTELRIADRVCKLAGSVDMIFNQQN